MPTAVPGLVRSMVGYVRFGCESPLRGPAGASDLRQSEVENFGVPALGHKDVGWLDVAMDDPFGVGGIERVCNLDASESSVSSSIGRLPIRCFSVCPSRYSMAMNAWPSFFPNVVDGADVGVVQGGSCLSLAPETL